MEKTEDVFSVFTRFSESEGLLIQMNVLKVKMIV